MNESMGENVDFVCFFFLLLGVYKFVLFEVLYYRKLFLLKM